MSARLPRSLAGVAAALLLAPLRDALGRIQQRLAAPALSTLQ